MIRIGITGGIGSGKTYVSHLLQSLGVPVYDSDSRAKQLTVADAGIRQGLMALLGEQVYRHGKLNKDLLASYLFASRENADRVNAVIHPVVFRDFDRWCEQAGVCVVSAPLELRIQRTMERDGRDRAAVEARIQAQMDEREREERADYVIVNDGICPLLPQLEKMLQALKARKNA